MNSGLTARADRLALALADAGPEDSPLDGYLVTELTNV